MNSRCILHMSMLKTCSFIPQNLGCVLYTSASHTQDGTVSQIFRTKQSQLVVFRKNKERPFAFQVLEAATKSYHEMYFEQMHLWRAITSCVVCLRVCCVEFWIPDVYMHVSQVHLECKKFRVFFRMFFSRRVWRAVLFLPSWILGVVGVQQEATEGDQLYWMTSHHTPILHSPYA